MIRFFLLLILLLPSAAQAQVVSGGGSGVAEYASYAALPACASEGSEAKTTDTGAYWVCRTGLCPTEDTTRCWLPAAYFPSAITSLAEIDGDDSTCGGWTADCPVGTLSNDGDAITITDEATDQCRCTITDAVNLVATNVVAYKARITVTALGTGAAGSYENASIRTYLTSNGVVAKFSLAIEETLTTDADSVCFYQVAADHWCVGTEATSTARDVERDVAREYLVLFDTPGGWLYLFVDNSPTPSLVMETADLTTSAVANQVNLGGNSNAGTCTLAVDWAVAGYWTP